MQTDVFNSDELERVTIKGSKVHREGEARLYDKAGYLVITHTVDPSLLDPLSERDTGQTLCIELEPNKGNEELITLLQKVISLLAVEKSPSKKRGGKKQ